MTDDLEVQALAILDSLTNTPFEQCIPITRSFKNVTANASIYAVRHRELGLLYVGKTRYSRERFRDGHKAFLWSWLDHYDSDDVRLLLYPLDFIQLQTLSSSLEALSLLLQSHLTTPGILRGTNANSQQPPHPQGKATNTSVRLPQK